MSTYTTHQTATPTADGSERHRKMLGYCVTSLAQHLAAASAASLLILGTTNTGVSVAGRVLWGLMAMITG
ncbi:MAG: hypothetical protein JSV78_13430 [Phycisphaerales bacterium]|nr:MAG: hypothetical protein JSV78_13430 [Phycisphaerales bacterium]